MSIFHFSAKVISRAEGRSSVAAAAYRSGEKITEDRTGEIHDYTRKGGVIGGDIILPGGGTMLRSELWNKVEAAHKRKDSVVAREFELAIPCELNALQSRVLIETFATELASCYGAAVDWNIHQPTHGKNETLTPNHGAHDPRNVHAHVMLTACYVSADGVMGKKCAELDPIHCARAKILNPMEVQRERWQDLCNSALESAGRSERVDHRTLEAQGITDRLPGVHLGPTGSGMKERGEVSDIEARAKRKADEFIAKVQADAAIYAAAIRDVDELEQQLKIAKDEAVLPPTREQLEQQLEPMLARLRECQEVIDESARRRPTAKPLADIQKAQKSAPELREKTVQAKGSAAAMAKELKNLPWWRPLRKRALNIALPRVKKLARTLENQLEKVEALIKAVPLEQLETIVLKQQAVQAELAPKCWPIQRQLAEIEAEAAFQADTEAEAVVIKVQLKPEQIEQFRERERERERER